MSVTESLCLSQKVCVCHRKSVSVTYILFLSQTACVLSQTVCVCHSQSGPVTDRLFLPKAYFLIVLGRHHDITWFPSRFVPKVLICPSFGAQDTHLLTPVFVNPSFYTAITFEPTMWFTNTFGSASLNQLKFIHSFWFKEPFCSYANIVQLIGIFLLKLG